MRFGAYGILVIFGLFILLLIVNPNLSCFGKRVKSPFYPLLRKKSAMKRRGGAEKDVGEDKEAARKKTEDYGFRLD